MSETTNAILEIDRGDVTKRRIVTEPLAPLEDGQVRVHIERFALTANNVTYAVAGDMLGYWDFFPAELPWGRVPAMGWAEVVESANPDVAVGGRYYGWFPMARYVTTTVAATPTGLRDDGPHRQAHAPVYRSWTQTTKDPWYETGEDAEDRHALLRGLFLTGFLADAWFADQDYLGAEEVLVVSASSKTAIGFAQNAAEHDGVAVVGITSAGNADFVSSLGMYDEVVTYDDVDGRGDRRCVLIDMAGNATVVGALHRQIDDRLAASMIVGRSHHDAAPAPIEGGPEQTFFFAPTEVERRIEEWGAADYEARTTAALQAFVASSHDWLEVDRRSGEDAAAEAWDEVVAGSVPPSKGLVVGLG